MADEYQRVLDVLDGATTPETLGAAMDHCVQLAKRVSELRAELDAALREIPEEFQGEGETPAQMVKSLRFAFVANAEEYERMVPRYDAALEELNRREAEREQALTVAKSHIELEGRLERVQAELDALRTELSYLAHAPDEWTAAAYRKQARAALERK